MRQREPEAYRQPQAWRARPTNSQHFPCCLEPGLGVGNPMSFPLGLHSQGRENLGTVRWKGLTFYRELMGGTQKSPVGELQCPSGKQLRRMEYTRQALFSESHPGRRVIPTRKGLQQQRVRIAHKRQVNRGQKPLFQKGAQKVTSRTDSQC